MAISIYGATLSVFGARLAGGVGLLMHERRGHSLVFSIAILNLVLSALGLFCGPFTEVAAAALVLKPLIALKALLHILVAA